MSTDYRFKKTVSRKQLIAAAKKCGFHICNISIDEFCITDSISYVWCYTHKHKNRHVVSELTRYGVQHNAEYIVNALSDALNSKIISEDD